MTSSPGPMFAYLYAISKPAVAFVPNVDEFDTKIAAASKDGAIDVVVNAKEGAPRYSGVTIKNVKVTQSPDWLKSKLLSIGLRPINNIVDITNLILMEMGQPLHAFDADKIKGGKVVVDYCKQGTKFTTLDEVERELSDKDLMICNAQEPMCIAGVFGGLDSGVTENTTNIFLESAYFNPVSVRKTSKRHTLKTDASFRFERGCDPMVTPYALKRAALLVLELAGGELVGELVDEVSAPFEKKVVELDYARMQRFIGKEIGAKTIRDILEYLDMEFVSESESGCPTLMLCGKYVAKSVTVASSLYLLSSLYQKTRKKTSGIHRFCRNFSVFCTSVVAT